MSNNLIFWLALFSLGVIFLPKYGLLMQFKNWWSNRQREKVEDALKHLLESEHAGRHTSPESLGGLLQISRSETLKLIARMEAQGLVQTRGLGLHMTSEGERWALHVVRAHRLWERYLADEARLPLEQVHQEAHRREHGMTPDQVNRMAASLGFPDVDPHGDPIPTEEGKFDQTESLPATAWPLDTPGRIVHLEDEPPLAYKQILAEGLQLDQILRVLETSPDRLVLSDGVQEYRLAPAVAANIFLCEMNDGFEMPDGVIPLNLLPDTMHAQVVDIHSRVQGFTRRRLLDMGLTPGTRLTPELTNFFGDPRAYRVRGALIALRKEQAADIWVRPEKEEIL